ncbi:MAG: nuclear transport factor 2 family protein [Bradyrhizobium sp.]|uniref:YybH family protein n=1 Tax=Bradyrhizobium sp. TaxID=376 RepID=UPI00271CAE2A|nr:nuclear transport factor 2 family protein [Bradyrhizobium sp.]MDO9563516.1 nuclear transport factor 2 family protein [Bradyrhizobium sp.]MDP3693883.1 nuclear transport factor 2 family protein [Bradyrhizobium sp.]
MASAADDVASDLMSRWAECFGRFDAEAQASLYSRHALFFGSNPTLYRGRDGVRAYFEALPKWDSRAVRFTDISTAQVNPDLVNFAAIAWFDVDGAPRLSVKITWVIVREDGDWKIVSHHVSPKAPLI